jgi:hypothetical protein
MRTLTAAMASRFARIALGHVTREYPHKLDHVLNDGSDALPPSALHPIYHGSFDWHSCVHGYWLLARVQRRFPLLPEGEAARALMAEMLTPETVAGELAYLERPSSGGFERPYGWAWLLALHAELARHEDQRRATTLAPLAYAFATRFHAWLPKLGYPVRSGTHFNTAFALLLARSWADVHDALLRAAIDARAVEWFGADRNCQAWEPGGEDFLSPALIEAACMRNVLPSAEFRRWLAAFLPDLGAGQPAPLFQPAHVSDRTDGRIAHLDGLNLSRAWCWRVLAAALDPVSPEREVGLRAAKAHLNAAIDHIKGDYAGEHWLSTYALLALDGLGDS